MECQLFIVTLSRLLSSITCSCHGILRDLSDKLLKSVKYEIKGLGSASEKNKSSFKNQFDVAQRNGVDVERHRAN